MTGEGGFLHGSPQKRFHDPPLLKPPTPPSWDRNFRFKFQHVHCIEHTHTLNMQKLSLLHSTRHKHVEC